jgi:arginine deiminase
MVKDMGIRIIDVTKEESVYSQACNCICLGSRKIIYYDLCMRVYEKMREHDIEVHLVQGSELVKGRGGPRCMTRPIYKGLDGVME